MRTCIACGATHERASDYCGRKCRQRSAYRLKAGIDITDERSWRYGTNPRRKGAWSAGRPDATPPYLTCPDCGGRRACGAMVCKPCRAKRQQIRSGDDHRVQRKQREHAAPGLSSYRRLLMLAKWKRRGVHCAYCPELATTVDHAVPLVRGGTNYEGNLVPCCRSCNSRKGGRLIIEMRAGRKAPRMTEPLHWDAIAA